MGTVRAFFFEKHLVAGDHHQRLPVLAFFRGHIQQQVEVDTDEAGHIFGPFDISAHPVD